MSQETDSADTISKLVDEVEIEIFAREEKEISTSLIGELIMDRLKDLDAVAYVRLRRFTESLRMSIHL